MSCDLIGTVADRRKVGTVASNGKARRLILCETYASSAASNGKAMAEQASFSEATIAMSDKLKSEFPQIHVSRRSSIHKRPIPVHVDIDETIEKD